MLLVLVIDPENKTCVEFQIVIKEKLEQGRSNRMKLFVYKNPHFKISNQSKAGSN
jgi:hypothetical protein